MPQFDFYPYGTQYHRAPTPLPDEWEEDMAELSAAGYTHVQFRPQWRWHEAQRGQFVFDDLDRLFELAEAYHLRVVLKPMLETAPDWAFTELGGTRVGFHGVPLSPFAHGAYYVGGWWPCFDNPGVMQAALLFIRALTTRYKDHPALWIYNAWNEPRSRPMGSCQCSHSQALYRQWLEERFGTIEDLNDFYGKRWTSFNTLSAPCGVSDYAEMALWRDWAAVAVADQVRQVIATIKEEDSTKPVMFHRGGVDVLTDIAWDAGDDVRNAAVGCDWYGLSCPIEFHPKTPQDHALASLTCDWIRRVDSSFWVHEFYPRQANWERSPHIDHLQRQSLMTIASGTRGFTWWQYRSERVGNETDGYGLTEINGSPTERSEYASALAGFFRQYGDQLTKTSAPRARVAVLYDRQSDMVSRMSVGQDVLSGRPETAVIATPYKEAMTGAHALYWLHNIERDFVIPGDDLTGYRVLHLSGVEMVSSEAASWLKQYVANGGFLIIEFPFACRDDNTWVSKQRPNHDLQDLLGCREIFRVKVDDLGDDRVLWAGVGELEAKGFRCDLQPTTGETLAHWIGGKSAIVRHSYGKGQVISLGLNVSQSSLRGTVPTASLYFQKMCEIACIQPFLPFSLSAKVIGQRRIHIDQQVTFLFNLTEDNQEVPIDLAENETWWGPEERTPTGHLIVPAGKTWIGRSIMDPKREKNA